MEAVLGALFLKNAKIVSATQKSKAIHVSLEKEKKKFYEMPWSKSVSGVKKPRMITLQQKIC